MHPHTQRTELLKNVLPLHPFNPLATSSNWPQIEHLLQRNAIYYVLKGLNYLTFCLPVSTSWQGADLAKVTSNVEICLYILTEGWPSQGYIRCWNTHGMCRKRYNTPPQCWSWQLRLGDITDSICAFPAETEVIILLIHPLSWLLTSPRLEHACLTTHKAIFVVSKLSN